MSPTVIVAQPSFLAGLAAVFADTPIETFKAYLTYNLLSSYSGYLSAPFVEEDFAFELRTLRGVPEIQPRWKRAVSLVDRLLGFDLGKVYVERTFPPESKAHAERMVANLIAVYRDGVATLDWMGPETRREALAKLEAMVPMIAYPAKWRDYTALDIRKGDLAGNVMRSRRFDYEYWLGKVGRKVDRQEWFTTPQTVNAFYSSSRNQIVFPAGILQPPFFDAGADDAANYGAIGSVIGHEISHAFDDHGSQFDGDGNLRNWWTVEDRDRFDKQTHSLVAQYDAFSRAARLSRQRRADVGGERRRQCRACDRRAGLPAGAPGLRGAGHRRLFRRAAAVHRLRPDLARQGARGRPYRAPEDRSAFARKIPGRRHVAQPEFLFVEAFDVKPGDAMYLPREERIALWQTDRQVVCPGKAP